MASLALGAIAFGQPKVDDRVIEQSFPEVGSSPCISWATTPCGRGTGRIRVRWHAEDAQHERDMEKIKVRTDLFGSVATIRTQGPTSHARFTIEIPGRSDLHLRIRAGDVRIEGIEGNQDVRMTAGDLDIDVAPDSLRHVHASVSIGDLKARALGIDKDGFKSSLDWFGDGAYTLDARMFAGDMTLR